MLRGLASAWRCKAAGCLAALYLVCLVLPILALALLGTEAAAASRSDVRAAPTIHLHAGGVVHSHAHGAEGCASESGTKDVAKDKAGGCCGLFYLAGIAAVPAPVLGDATPSARLAPSRDPAPGGRTPDLIHRPPIVPSSF
jgi:hypothetical protein